MENVIERMRREWDARATEDAKYYTAFQRRNQDDTEYDQGAADVLSRIKLDYPYLPTAKLQERRFLEIGCGLGRLMRSLAADCGEIHGVDISPEMIARCRERLSHIANAHFTVAYNSNMEAFADSSFDFIYSFAVFQHVPDRTIIYRYMDDAFRVLKPGGLLTAQFNGAPPFESDSDTWVGVRISEEDLLRYASEKGWPVISSEGANTQFLWLTLRKPALSSAPVSAGSTATIYNVRHPDGGAELTAGGLRGFAEVYVRDLSDTYSDLTKLSVRLDTQTIKICYIGAIKNGGWRQINVQIPEETPPGCHNLAFYWNGQQVSNVFPVMVRSLPPLRPRLISITDSNEFYLGKVVKSGALRINLAGCRNIQSFQAMIGDTVADQFDFICVQPLAREYQISLYLPQNVHGVQTVRLSVDGEELPACEIEVLRSVPEQTNPPINFTK